MPVTPTYPGVYIQEKPSGVHPIIGVATSITAFVGRTQRGPVHLPVTINGFSDYERIFGGLDVDSRTSYAVRDFFLNGGSQAVILRLYHGDPDPLKNIAKIEAGGVKLQAASWGKWGNNLRLTVDTAVLDSAATQLGIAKDKIFSIIVTDATTGTSETFANVTLVDSARRLDTVLRDSSELVRWQSGAAIGGTTAAPTAGVSKDNISKSSDSAGTAAKDWRKAEEVLVQAEQAFTAAETALAAAEKALTAAQAALAKATADGLTGAALKPFQDDADAKTTARDTAKTTHTAAKNAHDNAGTDRNTKKDAVKTTQEAVQTALQAIPAIPDAALLLTDYQNAATGLPALERTDLVNILCLPPDMAGDIEGAVWDDAAAFCERRRAMLLVDPPRTWTNKDAAKAGVDGLMTRSRNAALFFPRLLQFDPLRDNQQGEFVPCGSMAGIFARTDAERGVWKAPAGIEATLRGSSGLRVLMNDGENGELNPLAINCLREFRNVGRVSWGARTLRGADALTDEYKYIPVRRLTLFIEESLFRGTKWVVFEPNDEPLWAQIRLNVGAFMNTLFRQGAFQGQTPRDAYLVKCDRETNPQAEVDKGIVNILVGFAPLKPAEFVVIKIQQLSGKLDV